MAINSATVSAKAIRLKSPSGVFHEATSAVYNSNTGELKFSLLMPYTVADKGTWEIYTAEQNRIADTAGNLLILNEKIGEFLVEEPVASGGTSDPTDVSALRTRQDEQATALQKATQSIADLAILVAKGTGTTGGATSAELTALKDKLTALDTAKAEKTALDALDTSVKALQTALEDGATDDELAAAIKTVNDAIAAIEKSLLPLVGRTLYTLDTTTNALIGDSIFIDKEGDIQFPAAPTDGAEITVLDPWRRVKSGKNNILSGAGDQWLLADGTYDSTTLTFSDNQLYGGRITFKYSAPTKSWSGYVTYGSPVQLGGEAPVDPATPVTADTTETVTLSTLTANTWTNIPSPTGQNVGKSVVDYRVFNAVGEDITTGLDSRFTNGAWQVRSLSLLSNLKFVLELSGVGTGSNSVLSVLPANVWTDIPIPSGTAATKKIVDYKALTDTGEDITDALELRLVADQWEVRSLSEIKNVQFNLELV